MDNFISQTDTSLKKKKRRWKPKGRQVENNFHIDVSNLLAGIDFKRDELIEYLHLLQDNFGVLYDKHLVALSNIINLPLSEIYEVATFYAHFNIVKNSETYESIKVVRVCESLTCELFGARQLLKDLKSYEDKNIKVLPGPCMGSGAGDCNCQTQIIQNDFLPSIVGSWQWEGSGVGSSAFEWGNVATEICMCTPGPTLMNALQTACRRMGGSGVPTPGGGGGTGNWGGQGSGRFSKGGRIRRRRRRR